MIKLSLSSVNGKLPLLFVSFYHLMCGTFLAFNKDNLLQKPQTKIRYKSRRPRFGTKVEDLKIFLNAGLMSILINSCENNFRKI